MSKWYCLRSKETPKWITLNLIFSKANVPFLKCCLIGTERFMLQNQKGSYIRRLWNFSEVPSLQEDDQPQSKSVACKVKLQPASQEMQRRFRGLDALKPKSHPRTYSSKLGYQLQRYEKPKWLHSSSVNFECSYLTISLSWKGLNLIEWNQSH